mmetsp:Transcript_132988/g.244553  ORF Transcript_132988/g.244553 Transcript_132988/m.244553 type:complete len:89 (+) Transcript_132988:2156-2422(+)
MAAMVYLGIRVHHISGRETNPIVACAIRSCLESCFSPRSITAEYVADVYAGLVVKCSMWMDPRNDAADNASLRRVPRFDFVAFVRHSF